MAIYFAYHFASDENPECILIQFIQGYIQERPLLKVEAHITNTLFNILRPFRFDRVEPILDLITLNKRNEVEAKIEETINLSEKDYKLDHIFN